MKIDGGKAMVKITRKYRGTFQIRLFLVVFDDYFKGAGDSLIRTNKLAQGAPVALVHFNHLDNIVDNYQRAAGADANTQTAALTFFFIYYRRLYHNSISPSA
jgi:hypothetical protein